MPTPLNPDDFHDMDEPLNVDMDPEDALRLLLAVSPDDEDENID